MTCVADLGGTSGSDLELDNSDFQCVCEGQRLGPFGMTARKCNKKWPVPGSDFVIPSGTRVIIPIVSQKFFIIHLIFKLLFLVWTAL